MVRSPFCFEKQKMKRKGYSVMTKKEDGFSLIELAVVLAIVGVLVGAAMMLVKPTIQMARLNATRAKLERISDSMAYFVQNYGRLPCPAAANPGTEPFGAPINSGTNGTGVTNSCGTTIPNNFIGIIPFRALGLDEDNAKDAYGNFITYAVSPVLAGLTLIGATAPGEVHEVCRTRLWMEEMPAGSGAWSNRNKRKAQICCVRPHNNSDVKIWDRLSSTNSVFTGRHDESGSLYDDADADPPVATPANIENRLIAYALVSHGENGDGAFIRGGGQNPVTVSATAQESENRDGDLEFVSTTYSKTRDNNYFDDVILWKTNDQLISHFGNDSCGRP